MSPDTPTRRSFLRASAAAGLATATAGCVELLPPLGQRVRFGRVDVPDGGPPDYRAFAPAQSVVPDDAYRPTLPGIVTTPSVDGTDVVGAPVGFGRSFVGGLVDYFGVGLEHYDLAVKVGPAVVLEGPVEADAVGDVLTASGYEPADGYESYDRYSREDVPRTVAVADGRIVYAAGEHRDAYVEGVIDAAAGRVPRRHEADDETDEQRVVSEAYADVTTAVGGRPFLLLGQNDPIRNEQDVAFSATGMDYDADAVYWITHSRYEPGVEAPADELRSALQEDRRAFFANGVDLRTDGRDAVVYSEIPHDRFRDEFTAEYPPHATWGVRETADGVVVRHEAGDAVDAARLSVVARPGNEPVPSQFEDQYDVVSRGAELAVSDVPDGATSVAVTWEAEESETMVTLLTYDRP